MSNQLSSAQGDASKVLKLMDGHLSFKQIEAFVVNKLTPDQREQVKLHLDLCPDCKREADDLGVLRSDIKPPHVRLITRGRLLIAGVLTSLGIVVIGFINLVSQSADLPAEYTTIVNQAVAQSYVAIPADILGMGGATPNLRGPALPTFPLKTPVRTLILTTKPEFSWEPIPETAQYTVSIYDDKMNRIDHSGPLTDATWKPTVSLNEGAVYEWQVRAATISRTLIAPGPQDRRAKFRIATAAEAKALKRTRTLARGDHLLLGVLFAQAGALDDAETELKAAGTKASGLLSYIQNVRR